MTHDEIWIDIWRVWGYNEFTFIWTKISGYKMLKYFEKIVESSRSLATQKPSHRPEISQTSFPRCQIQLKGSNTNYSKTLETQPTPNQATNNPREPKTIIQIKTNSLLARFDKKGFFCKWEIRCVWSDLKRDDEARKRWMKSQRSVHRRTVWVM